MCQLEFPIVALLYADFVDNKIINGGHPIQSAIVKHVIMTFSLLL